MSFGRALEQPDLVATRDAVGGGIRWRSALILVLGNVALFGAGIALTYVPKVSLAGLALTIPAAALLTFVILFSDSHDIRTAITGSFVVLYLGLVSASFNRNASRMFEQEGSLLSELLTSFNALMLTIIGFYFGGKAIEEAAGRIAVAREGQGGGATPPPGGQA